MPLDGIFLHCLCDELNTRLRGARVDKIHHPGREEVVLHLRTRTSAPKCLFVLNPARARVHLTAELPENPKQPSMFCMLLRKHLIGAQLLDSAQHDLDRVAVFRFAATSEIGEAVQLRLCAEFTGKHCNLILVREDGTIIDALRRIDATQSAMRRLLPGIPYLFPPPQSKHSLYTQSAASCLTALEAFAPLTLSDALLKCLDGFSPLLCREVSYRVAANDPKIADLNALQRDLLLQQLEQAKALLEQGGTPVLLRSQERLPAYFSCMPLTHLLGAHTQEFCADYSSLLDAYYTENDRAVRANQRSQELQKLLQTRIARTVRKLEAQRAELLASQDREQLRVFAELILANRAQLEADPAAKGASVYRLENYYDGGHCVTIPVNPSKSPSANAQQYYKEYQRAKTAARMLVDLIATGENELEYLQSAADFLSRSNSALELEHLRAELEQQGICKRKQVKNKKPAALPPLEYETSDGLRVLVGRSNTQNDALTFRQAHGNDLWLHAQGYAGSHVILLTSNQPPPKKSVEEAAALAAWHSKAQASSHVPVDFTPVKCIKKPNGALPGKVIYHHYETIIVNPSARTREKA
ncbi:MAG: NFACT family protein [Oscillospiraceae bacterium]|jgi:predicted ribosome quality control (RQC) complex YloA/Tae2 family protein|nr:NFACT family protein [Oscillospiraceae bacterium]